LKKTTNNPQGGKEHTKFFEKKKEGDKEKKTFYLEKSMRKSGWTQKKKLKGALGGELSLHRKKGCPNTKKDPHGEAEDTTMAK